MWNPVQNGSVIFVKLTTGGWPLLGYEEAFQNTLRNSGNVAFAMRRKTDGCWIVFTKVSTPISLTAAMRTECSPDIMDGWRRQAAYTWDLALSKVCRYMYGMSMKWFFTQPLKLSLGGPGKFEVSEALGRLGIPSHVPLAALVDPEGALYTLSEFLSLFIAAQFQVRVVFACVRHLCVAGPHPHRRARAVSFRT